jgi:hypothetical protein
MATERPRERLCSDPIHNVGYLLPRTPLPSSRVNKEHLESNLSAVLKNHPTFF